MKKILLVALFFINLVSADFGSIKTISTDFEQKVINESGQVLKYTGTMFAKKSENQALWIYTYPIEKEIYYKNGNIVIIEPDLEQATFAKINKVPNIITLLKRAKKVSEHRLVTRFNGTRYYILIDKNKIREISYVDEMKNKVSIRFIDTKINENISNSRFEYHIPKDYDILRTR